VESPPEEEVVLGESVPTDTPVPTIPPTDPDGFIYPAATIGSQSNGSVTLTSTDDAQTITDWYRNKIKQLNMNVRSFVQTTANDTVNNVLTAAKNESKIKVTITKRDGDSDVSIVISR